jgi:hypothetical protein
VRDLVDVAACGQPGPDVEELCATRRFALSPV